MNGTAEQGRHLGEQKLLERIFTDSSQPLEVLAGQFCAQEGLEDFRFGAAGLYGRAWDGWERENLFEAFHEVVYYVTLPELTLLLLRPGGSCRHTAERIAGWLRERGRARNLAYLTGEYRLSEARQVRAMLESVTAEMFFRDGTACATLEELASARKKTELRGEELRRLRRLRGEIAASLTRGEAEQVRESLTAYFETSARGGPTVFREQCAGLYFRVEEEADIPDGQESGCREDAWGNGGKSLYQLLEDSDSAGELMEHLTRYIDCLLDWYRPLRKDTGYRVAAYVEEYIQRHYMEAFAIEDIAAGLSLSVNYVRSVFKAGRGQTIQSYLSEYRLEKACRLLRNTSETVGRVGQLVGYNNVSYFCAAFQKRYGKTPSQWRRAPRHGERP